MTSNERKFLGNLLYKASVTSTCSSIMSLTCCFEYFQVEVHHARSIDEIFDDISYKKGSAVIRMLQGYLGNDMFQVG